MTVLYIHGFASTGGSSKVDALRSILAPTGVLAPSLDHHPARDFELLCTLCKLHNVTTVVGTSLGGFYALALAQKFDLRAVLINPALRPYETLRNRIGTVPIYGTDRTFEWTETSLRELREVAQYVDMALHPQMSSVTWANTRILLGAKDDVVDPVATAALFKYKHVIVDPDEDHRFNGLSKYTDMFRALVVAPSDYGDFPVE